MDAHQRNLERNTEIGRSVSPRRGKALLQRTKTFARLNILISEYCTFFSYVVGGLLGEAPGWNKLLGCTRCHELPALLCGGPAAAWGTGTERWKDFNGFNFILSDI